MVIVRRVPGAACDSFIPTAVSRFGFMYLLGVTDDASYSYVEDLECRLERMEKLMNKARLFAYLLPVV